MGNEFKNKLNVKLMRLHSSIDNQRANKTCLRRWSEFIRFRDGYRCVVCHSMSRVSAHHICRKSFLEEAKFYTGNGITLCIDCHKVAHKGFNGKADYNQPMDAQGGEKIEIMLELYGELINDAYERGLLCDEYYFLSDLVLCKFKLLQGYDPFSSFPGTQLEQAYLIWRQCPLPMRNAILEANGFSATTDYLLPGMTIRYINGE
ncbi:TPA: HNH endonuclease [Serratia marcescens]|nr:HNH endonuclease [Serratia marcescens]